MNGLALAKWLVDWLDKLSGPVKGYRTALGVLVSLGLLAYAVYSKDAVIFMIAAGELLRTLGVRQGEPDVPVLPFENE